MPGTKHNGRYELTPEQQQIVDDGLRIFARMIVRRFVQDSGVAGAQGGGKGGNSTEVNTVLDAADGGER